MACKPNEVTTCLIPDSHRAFPLGNIVRANDGGDSNYEVWLENLDGDDRLRIIKNGQEIETIKLGNEKKPPLVG